MAWSTRELAELAGTTVKAVRHYHEIGILDEPERRSNGYKQYGAAHLIRLLRIMRLKELGIPLAALRADAAAEDLPAAIRRLDGELVERIEHLQRIRAELATALEHGVPLDTPAAFHAVSQSISEADRGLATVIAGVFDDAALGDLSALMAERSDAETMFDELPADADDPAIDAVARAMEMKAREDLRRYPQMAGFIESSPLGAGAAARAVGTAIYELYNPAQVQALVRLAALLAQ